MVLKRFLKEPIMSWRIIYDDFYCSKLCRKVEAAGLCGVVWPEVVELSNLKHFSRIQFKCCTE